ncbi:MAG: zinc ribbon domain-containing protein [bacterium]|nr:zinc ribbon domain-containing protein [bacterium]
MPIYEYECRSCGYRTETMQRVTDPPLKTCPECAGEYKKLISPPALQFKGSGWYVTDYAGKKSGAADQEKAADKASESKDTAGKAAEKKTTPESGSKKSG